MLDKVIMYERRGSNLFVYFLSKRNQLFNVVPLSIPQLTLIEWKMGDIYLEEKRKGFFAGNNCPSYLVYYNRLLQTMLK